MTSLRTDGRRRHDDNDDVDGLCDDNDVRAAAWVKAAMADVDKDGGKGKGVVGGGTERVDAHRLLLRL